MAGAAGCCADETVDEADEVVDEADEADDVDLEVAEATTPLAMLFSKSIFAFSGVIYTLDLETAEHRDFYREFLQIE